MLEGLHADGFARVSEWASFGLELSALAVQVAHAMSPRFARRKLFGDVSSAPLPALEPLLNSAKLAHVLQGYLGESIRYDGHSILRLTDRANLGNYASSQWHHDRCGRRLKLFIFMHDVDRGTRPTLVAARSQNTLYYSHANPWNLMSRYSDKR